MALVVAHTLTGFDEAGRYQTGDPVLGICFADLGEAGALEWQGDLSGMQLCELCLPAKSTTLLDMR